MSAQIIQMVAFTRIIGLWTTEICILYIGKKAGILASGNLYIGILLMEIGIFWLD